jgi:hypothetical protein
MKAYQLEPKNNWRFISSCFWLGVINLKLVIPKFKESHSMVTNLMIWSLSPKHKKQRLTYILMAMSNWSPSCATSVHRKQCGDMSCVNAFNKGCCDLLKSECVIPSKPLCRYLQKKCFVPGRGPYYYCDTDRTVLRKHHHNFKALKLCLPDTFFYFVVMATTLVQVGPACKYWENQLANQHWGDVDVINLDTVRINYQNVSASPLSGPLKWFSGY